MFTCVELCLSERELNHRAAFGAVMKKTREFTLWHFSLPVLIALKISLYGIPSAPASSSGV